MGDIWLVRSVSVVRVVVFGIGVLREELRHFNLAGVQIVFGIPGVKRNCKRINRQQVRKRQEKFADHPAR